MVRRVLRRIDVTRVACETEQQMNAQFARIRSLNDALRTEFKGGLVVLSPGVRGLPPELRMRVIKQVKQFADFTTDIDPHQEHDFGTFELNEMRYIWTEQSQRPSPLAFHHPFLSGVSSRRTWSSVAGEALAMRSMV
jgi:hypothetical protein